MQKSHKLIICVFLYDVQTEVPGLFKHNSLTWVDDLIGDLHEIEEIKAAARDKSTEMLVLISILLDMAGRIQDAIGL